MPQIQIQQLDLIVGTLKNFSVQTIATIQDGTKEYPVYAFELDLGPTSEEKKKNTLFISGGVHGLEWVGTELCLSLLHTLDEYASWDKNFRSQLRHMRICVIPLVNPVGVARFWRSNGQGVDLMRNAPVESKSPAFLLGGQNVSKYIPWYRGKGVIQTELAALIAYVEYILERSTYTLSLDVHSGFGLQDQLWYPYAFSNDLFPGQHLIDTFTTMYRNVHPYHIYKIERQQYLTHGDVWDYLFLNDLRNGEAVRFLPLTLEIGSWSWLRKNPLQLFQSGGLFNPIKAHRHQRVLRRHWNLVSFIIRLLSNSLPFEAKK
jgi:hypothetical protein